MSKRDYYEVLGVLKNSTDNDIKKAYRRLAKQYHPDVNKEANAEEMFKEINEAYEILSDPQKRATYDQFGHGAFDQSGGGGFNGGFSGGFGGFEDVFESFFGGSFNSRSGTTRNAPRKGQDRLMHMKISFMDAIFGKTETISINVDEVCHQCSGSGAFSKSDIKICSRCNGKGTILAQQRTVFGVVQTQTACPDCQGTGKTVAKKCNVCKGTGFENKDVKVDVKIPEGVLTGQKLRVTGKGFKGSNGGSNGDLYIEIIVTPHPHFTREGKDIYIKLPLSSVDATLGTKIDVPTVYGDVELSIPAGTQPNQKFKLKGKGARDLRTGIIGDQYIEIDLKIPAKLSDEEKNYYKKLKDIEGTKKESVFDRFKKTFK